MMTTNRFDSTKIISIWLFWKFFTILIWLSYEYKCAFRIQMLQNGANRVCCRVFIWFFKRFRLNDYDKIWHTHTQLYTRLGPMNWMESKSPKKKSNHNVPMFVSWMNSVERKPSNNNNHKLATLQQQQAIETKPNDQERFIRQSKQTISVRSS